MARSPSPTISVPPSDKSERPDEAVLSDAVCRLLRAAPFAGPTGSEQDRLTCDEGSAYVLGRRGDEWVVDETRPLPDLLGWRAPRSVWGLVVVAPGSARSHGPLSAEPLSAEPLSLEPRSAGHDPRPASGGAEPVTVAVGVTRSGEAVGQLQFGPRHEGRGRNDPTAPHRLTDADEVFAPEGGRLPDTLMRNLDLPTPPPPEGTARFLALAWLAALVTAVPASPAPASPPSAGPADGVPPLEARPMGWPAVVRLHPAARLLHARGQRLRTAELDRVVAAAQTTWTWDVLRRAETCNPSIAPLCPPGTAAWMDTGMYARWVLDELPAAGPLWHQATTLVTPAARRRLQRCLEPAGVVGSEATASPRRRRPDPG